MGSSFILHDFQLLNHYSKYRGIPSVVCVSIGENSLRIHFISDSIVKGSIVILPKGGSFMNWKTFLIGAGSGLVAGVVLHGITRKKTNRLT